MEVLSDIKIRRGSWASVVAYCSWSTSSNGIGSTTFAPACSINRYYDPATDQFLSVDPDVPTTDQPYVFVNDDPLNLQDPLGIYAISGTGQNSFTTTTLNKETHTIKTTTIVTSGSKPAKVTVSTSPVTVPLGLGVSATISASATFSESGSQSSPSLNIGTDGSVGITANGATVSVADNGGLVMTSLSGSVASSMGPSVDIGGDQVTTSIDVSLNYSGQTGGFSLTPSEVTDILVFPLTFAKYVGETCLEDPPICLAGAGA
jgi:hypothetical protein